MGNLIDIVALIFIVFSAFQGFKSKAGSQFWALIALIVAVVFASVLSPNFSKYITFISDDNPSLKLILAFVILFILIHQGVQAVAKIFKLNFSLGSLDPIGGLVFAIIESSLFVGIIGLALMKVHELRFAIENTFLVSKLAKISYSVIILFGGKGLF